MSRKFSTEEMGASMILMTAVSSKAAEAKGTLQAVMDAGERLFGKPQTAHDKRYEVQLHINGVEVDFKAFEAHLFSQIEELFKEAAGDYVKNLVGSVVSRLEDMQGAADLLGAAIVGEADRMFRK